MNSINASGSLETSILVDFARATGLISGIYYEHLTGKPDFAANFEGRTGINPQVSTETRVSE